MKIVTFLISVLLFTGCASIDLYPKPTTFQQNVKAQEVMLLNKIHKG